MEENATSPGRQSEVLDVYDNSIVIIKMERFMKLMPAMISNSTMRSSRPGQGCAMTSNPSLAYPIISLSSICFPDVDCR